MKNSYEGTELFHYGFNLKRECENDGQAIWSIVQSFSSQVGKSKCSHSTIIFRLGD